MDIEIIVLWIMCLVQEFCLVFIIFKITNMHIKLSKIEKSKDLVEYVDCLEAEKEIEEPIPKTNEWIMNKLLKSNKHKQ